MSYFKINGQDFSDLVQKMKIGYETIVSSESGRNANGDNVIDVVNRKVKVYITFRPMDNTDMQRLLTAIKGFIVTVSYLDSETNTIKEITCNTGTPEPDYYWILNDKVLYRAFDLNFIEL